MRFTTCTVCEPAVGSTTCTVCEPAVGSTTCTVCELWGPLHVLCVSCGVHYMYCV